MSYTCNNCKRHVDLIAVRYHCTVCDDFDLCVNCKDKDGHPHQMEKLGFAFDNGFSVTNAQRLLYILCAHAQACRDANCHLPPPMKPHYCQLMKQTMMHGKCSRIRRNVDNCSMCKQLIALYFNRAKCLVPFCSPLTEETTYNLQQLTINDDSASALDAE